jgi:RimJ/RimL family protein N-acetyltransferase
MTVLARPATLRAFTVADAPKMAALAGDFDVARMTGLFPHPFPVIAAEGWILLTQAQAPLGRAVRYAVETAADGLIGGCMAVRSAPDHVEIGYWIGKPYWGRGYGTQIAEAITRAAIDRFGANPIAIHYCDNPASRHILQKVGYVDVGGEDALYSLARKGHAPGRRMVYRGT